MNKDELRVKFLQNCKEATEEALKRYFEWSRGKGKRRPPESFVQYVVAEKFAKLGCDPVLLEETARELIEGDRKDLPDRIKRGLIDIAVNYESTAINFVIETKIIKEKTSCNKDNDRIRDLLGRCPNLNCGVLIGYAASKDADSVEKLLEDVSKETGTSIKHRITPYEVTRRGEKKFYLGATIYLVSREPE